MINKIRENLRPLSLILIIPVINIFYTLLNNCLRGVFYMETGLDRSIPFLKVFIIPYIIWYPFIIVTLFYFCFKDKRTYYIILTSLILGLISSYITFFFFQTGMIRPNIEGTDVLSKLVSFIYLTDKPYNCFPSIHVFTSYLMIKGIFNIKSKNIKSILIVSVIGILVIISTLFVKQHVIWDVVGAIVLTELVFIISKSCYFKRLKFNFTLS